MTKKVIVYSTPSCPWCARTKAWLKENGIDFVDKDVTVDVAARNVLLSHGFTGVPVTQVDDEFIVGFNEPALKRALGLTKLPPLPDELKGKVLVYSTPSCPWCARTKAWLKENGIDFVDLDVSKPGVGRDRLIAMGFTGVPVTEINGEFIVGFNEPALKRALGLD